jgi:hypothetical protein
MLRYGAAIKLSITTQEENPQAGFVQSLKDIHVFLQNIREKIRWPFCPKCQVKASHFKIKDKSESVSFFSLCSSFTVRKTKRSRVTKGTKVD